MSEFNRSSELQQPVSLEQAEADLMRANAVLDLYDDFDHTPRLELWAFQEACDRWLWAQVREHNRHEN